MILCVLKIRMGASDDGSVFVTQSEGLQKQGHIEKAVRLDCATDL